MGRKLEARCSLERFYSSKQERNEVIRRHDVQKCNSCSLLLPFKANSKIPNWEFWLLVDTRKHAETKWRMESSGLKGKPAARLTDTQTQRESAWTLDANTFNLCAPHSHFRLERFGQLSSKDPRRHARPS